MNKKIRIICFFSSLLLIILSGICLAKVRVQAVERFFNDIKIKVNGTEVIPKDSKGNIIEPFIIEGTTYLPVRAIGEVLGMDVDWDSENYTVLLSKKIINENAESTDTKDEGEITIKENDETIINKFIECDKYSEKESSVSKTNLYYSSSASMEIGDKKQLEVYVYGNKSYTVDWSSSNEKVAIVDENGVLLAKQTGNTTITAKISNGVTQTLKITVLEELPTIKYSSKIQSFIRKNYKANIHSIKVVQNGTNIRVEGVSEILTATNSFNINARIYDSDGCYVGQYSFDISKAGIKSGEKTKFSKKLVNYYNTFNLNRGETYYMIFD